MDSNTPKSGPPALLPAGPPPLPRLVPPPLPPIAPPAMPPPLPPLRRSARTLGIAVLWMAAGLAAAFCPAFLIFFASGLHNGLRPDAPHWNPGLQAHTWLGVVGFNAVLLCATWIHGRTPGQGSRRAQLGWLPIRRHGLLVTLALADVAFLLGALPIIVHAFHITPRTLVIDWTQAATGGLGPVRIGNAMATAVLAPIGEELFFRGWLWTALRRHWRPLPVAAVTAIPWLLLHVTSGWERPLVLIPAAILFSIARHFCGSVRASIVVHMVNNIVVVAAILITQTLTDPGIPV